MKDKQCLEPAERLPKGWEWKMLGELGKFIRGVSYKKDSLLPKRSDESITLLRANNIQDKLDLNDLQFLPKSDIKEIQKIKNNDILFCMSSGSKNLVGKNIVLNNLEGFSFGAFCSVFRSINTEYTNYLGYFLKSNEYQKQINYYSQGTNILNLRTNQLEEILLPVPPLSEQKQIVSVLDKTFEKLDQAIALVEKNIQKLKQLNESVLDEVFSKLNKDERKFRLVDIADVKRGKSKHRPRNDKSLYGGSYPLIQTGDIRNAEKFITDFSQTYNEKGLEQSKLWEKGTICLTIAANIGDVAILGIDACFPDSVVGIYSKEYNNIYIYYFLKSIQRKLDEKSSASAQKNLSVEKLSDFYIPLPDNEEQQRIVAYLDQTTDKNQKLTQYYQNKLEALKSLKNSLLDSAFKGALRREKVIQFKAKTFNELYPDPYVRKNREIQKKNNARRSVLTTARIIDIHQKNNQKLGHTKVEKINHAIEYIVGYELYRDPVKDVGGPVDFYYLNKYVEPFAKEKKVFEAIKTEEGYYYETKENFNLFLDLANNELGEFNEPVNQLIQEFVFLSLRETELYMTVYAGWNNLIIRKEPVSLESIYNESITLWSNKADKFDKDDVQNAINWLNNKKYIPKGNGKEVK